MSGEIVKTIVSWVRSYVGFDPVARAVVIDLTAEDIARIRYLSATTQELGLQRVTQYSYTTHWSCKCYEGEVEDGASHEEAMNALRQSLARVEVEELHVWDNMFHYSSYVEDSDSVLVECAAIPVSVLDSDEPFHVVRYCD
ncbi:hypothetical protein [Aeromonas sp. Y293-4]|uniref:hypothetical protein n=1 Tax=Aeromonas sp. Y293-4 TaxID=2990504 RepID=UPI0022E0512D|nr:hypothetical protein [Aeromonas sp. Y293-4]